MLAKAVAVDPHCVDLRARCRKYGFRGRNISRIGEKGMHHASKTISVLCHRSTQDTDPRCFIMEAVPRKSLSLDDNVETSSDLCFELWKTRRKAATCMYVDVFSYSIPARATRSRRAKEPPSQSQAMQLRIQTNDPPSLPSSIPYKRRRCRFRTWQLVTSGRFCRNTTYVWCCPPSMRWLHRL